MHCVWKKIKTYPAAAQWRTRVSSTAGQTTRLCPMVLGGYTCLQFLDIYTEHLRVCYSVTSAADTRSGHQFQLVFNTAHVGETVQNNRGRTIDYRIDVQKGLHFTGTGLGFLSIHAGRSCATRRSRGPGSARTCTINTVREAAMPVITLIKWRNFALRRYQVHNYIILIHKYYAYANVCVLPMVLDLMLLI